MTSPYDDGWLSGPLHELAVEIALNDPRTEVVARARVVKYMALVCDECRLILERETITGIPPERPREIAPWHLTHKGEIGPLGTTSACTGDTAAWCVVFVD